MADTNEFNAWQNQTPVVNKGTTEFDVWQYGAPVVDKTTTGSGDAGVGRPRVFIF